MPAATDNNKFRTDAEAMVKITLIQHNGERQTVEAKPGVSLMKTALAQGIPGIDADCYGQCRCATCHVYVDETWLAKVGEPGETEQSLLHLNPDRQANSRLSCQIEITEELDGLVVDVPEFQY